MEIHATDDGECREAYVLQVPPLFWLFFCFGTPGHKTLR